MRNGEILISGASVAGPALAYWLTRHGYKPTVVERTPALREGGEAIDIRGVALDVVERTGLLDDIRGSSTDIRGMSYVDPTGKPLLHTTDLTLTSGSTANADVEITPSDLPAFCARRLKTRRNISLVIPSLPSPKTSEKHG